MIELAGVTRRFGPRAALDAVSLAIPAGRWVAVLGPSGAGKTTLLRLLAGLDRPDAGRLSVLAARIGMVFQTPALWPHLSVRRHLEEVLRTDGLDADARARRRDELLGAFDLAACAERRPAALSGGEAQRLSLARAVAHRPQLLLLDEPFVGLDPLLRRDLAAGLERLHRELSLTTVHVTHHVDGLVRRADRVILLRDGRLHADGTLAELTAPSADEWTREFLAS
jgi:ABC-type sulfate/molybdate transport systems ATPase subunit